MGMLKKKESVKSASLHEGHVAALGEKFARMASEKGFRHTAMRGEHIMWQPQEDEIAVLGWGNGREIRWPEHAIEHAEDIEAFYKSIGPGHTGALRLGYVLQLGPIAELIFFVVAHSNVKSVINNFPTDTTRQWLPPSPSLGLMNNSLLADDVAAEITRQGIISRLKGEHDLARQAFLRCFIGGLACSSVGLQYSSVINLVNTYVDEQRYLRAYSLLTLAILLAVSLPAKMKDVADKHNQQLFSGLAHRIDETDRTHIATFFSPTKSVSVPELMWQVEDYDIGRALGFDFSL